MLRVALDVTPMASGNTGVSRYAQMHLDGLRRRADIDVRSFAVGRGPELDPSIRRVRVPLRVVQRGYRHLRLPRAEWFTGPVDVVHSIDIVPPPTRAHLVITIHDVLPITLPDQYAARQRMMIAAQLETAPRSSLVVTTCNATAAEILRHTNLRSEQLLVAPPGHRPPSPDAPPAPYAEPYVLAVGALTPRKGFHHLVDAMARLGTDAPLLVLVGPDGWESNVIRDRIAANPQLRVAVEGFTSDDRLEALYRHAAVFCHPSEAEGFGIPVLEAMGYGTAVVAADIPPVREIGGDAVALVPPRDPAALAEVLEALLRDGARRGEMIARGRTLAAPFTWDAMTATIVEGYQRLTGTPLPSP